MHEIFDSEKYREAAQKAYEFIKRMLDPSAWEVQPYYGEYYPQDYAYKLMWGGAENIPDDAERIDPVYTRPEQYYYPGYTGVIKGICRLPDGEDPSLYAVAVYHVSSDSRKLECYCPLVAATDENGKRYYTWSTGRVLEVWEYYLHAFDRSDPYMSDGQGGYIPWEPTETDPDPVRYYRTAFSTTKIIYWYWEDIEVGGDSTYAYEIEFVRKDWNIPVTDAVREEYFSDPEQRTGYVREDYIGLGASGSFNPLELISRSSVRQALSGWIGKDDMPMETPDLPEFITGYDAQIISQSFRLPVSTDRHRGMIEYGYSRFVDYKINLYALVPDDAEYLNAETILWSDVLYPLPEVPPPIPAVASEITDVVIMLGASGSRRNFCFLSTVDTADANVRIAGYSRFTAENKGYLSEKYSHVTYKAEVQIPSGELEYTLHAGEAETEQMELCGRPSVSGAFRFIAAGDPQLTNDESAANWRDSLQKAFGLYSDANFIAILGDNVDAQVDMALAEQQFSNFLSPPEMKTHPLLAVMGNHDDNMGFAGHFFLPNESSYGVAGGAGDYWVRLDKVLFLVLNTNVKDESIQQHIDFINETVAYYRNAYGRPVWTIALFHHSIFQPTNTAEEEQYVLLRNALAPCFSQNRVDLVLMGHVHSYCRTYVMDCSALAVGDTVTETCAVAGSGGSEFTKTSNGQTLYVTLNSASGSKFYPLSGEHWYAVKSEQQMVPHISCVDVDESRIIITTHRTSDMGIADQFTLKK